MTMSSSSGIVSQNLTRESLSPISLKEGLNTQMMLKMRIPQNMSAIFAFHLNINLSPNIIQVSSKFMYLKECFIIVEKSRPYLLLQVNSTDSWNRHRVEGYSFVQLPFENGYHQLEVETWRPRASLDTEIHSFFVGGSVRISKLEELVRTSYIDQDNFYEVVNRFGLETEDAGSIKVNINICTQDKSTQFKRRDIKRQLKQNEKLQSRRLVMDFVKEDNKRKEQVKNQKLLNNNKAKDSDSDFTEDGKVSDDEGAHANPIGVGGQTGF